MNLDLMHMERELVRAEMLRLKRETFPDDPNSTQFVKASGISRATIQQVLEQGSLPGVLKIEQWVKGCGLTLSQFFAHLEDVESGRKKKRAPEHEHPIIASVRVLLKRGDPADLDTLFRVVQKFCA